MKQQLKELDQKQQDFVQRIGEARDLLAELMFTSDAFFTLQKRELIHNLSCGCDHEDRYTKEGIIFCNDCGNTLGFVEESDVIDFDEPVDLSVADGVSTILNKDLLNEPSFQMPSGLTRELRHEWAKGCNTEESPFNYDLERMKEAVDSPTTLTLTGEHSQEEILELLLKAADELVIPEPPKAPILPMLEIKKINYCPYLDGGFCYANKDVSITNATYGGCFKPQECPANQG